MHIDPGKHSLTHREDLIRRTGRQVTQALGILCQYAYQIQLAHPLTEHAQATALLGKKTVWALRHTVHWAGSAFGEAGGPLREAMRPVQVLLLMLLEHAAIGRPPEKTKRLRHPTAAASMPPTLWVHSTGALVSDLVHDQQRATASPELRRMATPWHDIVGDWSGHRPHCIPGNLQGTGTVQKRPTLSPAN